MNEKTFAWTNRKLRPCAFCGKSHTFCEVEKLDRVFDSNGENYYQATIFCHFCGATVHDKATDPVLAAEYAINKWEHRADDKP